MNESSGDSPRNENVNRQNILSDEEKVNKRQKKQETKEKKQSKPETKVSPSKSANNQPKKKNDEVYKAVAGQLSSTSTDQAMKDKILSILFNKNKK